MASVFEKEWSELRGKTCESLNLASAGEQKNLGVWSALQTLYCRRPSGHRRVPQLGASHAVNSSRDELRASRESALMCGAGASRESRGSPYGGYHDSTQQGG